MIIDKDTKIDIEGDYPDLFIVHDKIEDKAYVKNLIDYFSNKAIADVKRNIDTFGRNYNFYKGELDSRDFYEASLDSGTDSFIMDLTQDVEEDMPEYVKLYSILAQPINALAGELTESPTERIVRAFDAESLNEIIEEKTNIVTEYINSRVSNKLNSMGLDNEDPQVQEISQREVQDQVSTITTHGEKWGNRKLVDLKAQLNYVTLEEKSAYSLLITGKSVLHVYENNSSQGFSAEHIDEVLVSTSKIKGEQLYSKAYQNSIVRLMEISEIIDRFKLTREEIEHIKNYKNNINNNLGEYRSRLSNKITGSDSIYYPDSGNMFDEDEYIQSIVEEELCGAKDMGRVFKHHGISYDIGNFALVVENYLNCKELIGELTYIDEDGMEVTIPVTDSYKEGSHPGEVSIEWGYINRWYKGIKIGSEVYKLEPVDYVPTSPVVGLDVGEGLLDLMKDRQIIYSLCINQLWELLQKELGVVFSMGYQDIPVGKDEEHEDAIESWLRKAEELGIVFNEYDTGKLKGGQQIPAKAIDLSRGNEMITRLRIAQEIKEEAYEMVGVSRSRLGSNLATETATAISNSRRSSYAQTMLWFNAHTNLFNEFYQTLLDTAQYYESQKEESTVVLSSTDGERAFLSILGSELTQRDLRIYLTSAPEDLADLAMAKELGMTMLQNGVDPYVISKIMFTNSIREIQEAFKKDRDEKRKDMEEQRDSEQKVMQHELAIETMREKSRRDEQREDRLSREKEKQLDRISNEKIAVIRAYGFQPSVTEDTDDSGTADILEVLDREDEIEKAFADYEQQIMEGNAQQIKEQNNIAKTNSEIRIKERQATMDYEIQGKKAELEQLKIKNEEKRLSQQLEVAKYYDKGSKKD